MNTTISLLQQDHFGNTKVVPISVVNDDSAEHTIELLTAKVDKLTTSLEYEKKLRLQAEDKIKELNLKIEELQNAVMRMEEFIAMQKREVDKAAAALEKERKKLTEVMMERKSHEKLKENAFEQFLQELNSAEGKEVDELTSYTYGQKNKN